MKIRQQALNEIERELKLRKDKGNEYVKWSLSQEEKEYISSLGYKISEEVYEIKTKKFADSKNISGILKDIHNANKKGKNTVFRNLKKDQIKILKKYNIEYIPIKYKIFL